MRKKVILIVDDEKEIHELLSEYLAPLNVEIYSAYNGRQGVELYRNLVVQGKYLQGAFLCIVHVAGLLQKRGSREKKSGAGTTNLSCAIMDKFKLTELFIN